MLHQLGRLGASDQIAASIPVVTHADVAAGIHDFLHRQYAVAGDEIFYQRRIGLGQELACRERRPRGQMVTQTGSFAALCPCSLYRLRR